MLSTQSTVLSLPTLATNHHAMIQSFLPAQRTAYMTVLSACVCSLLLHIIVWLNWHPDSEPAKLTPPKIVEVLLTAPPAAPAPVSIAPVPPKPVTPPPVIKPVIKPIIKKTEPVKPKLKPISELKKPVTKPEPTPTIQPKQELAPPAPAPVITPAPTAKPSSQPTPVAAAEPLVKAGYSSPSLHNPPTRYPRIAQMRQLEGTVILEIQVLASGSAGQVKIVQSSGHEVLDESAVEQVKAWHFTPAHRGTHNVDDWVKVPITFKFKR